MKLEEISCSHSFFFLHFSHFEGNVWLEFDIVSPNDIFSLRHKFILMKDKLKTFFLG